jgi:putative hydrolase of the HAD superfamily
MLRGLIVDLDDTLVDTEDARGRARAAVLAEVASCGHDPAAYWRAYARVEPDVFRLFADGAITKADYRVRRFADSLAAAGHEPDAELAERLNRLWLGQTTERAMLVPGARSLLDDAASRGIAVVVLTNGTSDEQQAKVDAVGIRPALADVLVSDAIGAAKPARRAFARALAALELPAESVAMIGNSLPEDIEGAIGAGIAAVLFDRARRYPDYRGHVARELADALTAAGEAVAGALASRR